MRKNGGAVEIKIVKLKEIKLSRNSRMNIRDEELSGLMASIKEEGMLEPIGLVKVDGGYEICYGNRRFLACSKLGYSTIPAVIHHTTDARDIDMKNLAENIQRRGINLQEAGRYMSMLQEKGLTGQEIAVRLGVSEGYVSSCLIAYKEVPEEFRKDLEVRVSAKSHGKAEKGKIGIKAASAIVSAKKSGMLNASQSKTLLKEARDNPNFKVSQIPHYIANIHANKKSVVDAVDMEGYRQVYVRFVMRDKDFVSLREKYCGDESPFKSVNELFKAILRGEKSVPIKMIKNR